MPLILNIDADTFAALCLFPGILILDICCRSNPEIFALALFFFYYFKKRRFYLFTSVAENIGVDYPNLSLFTAPPSVMATV